MEGYFQHQAELLSDEDGTASIVEIRGKDCLFEYDTGVDVFRGWVHDGESLADIDWKEAEITEKKSNKMMTLYITGYFDGKREAKDNMLGSGDTSALLECNDCGYWYSLSARQYDSARKEPLIVKCPKCAD